MDSKLYEEDKPKDCRFCYWWGGNKKGCILTEERCYYLLKPVEPKVTPCTGCPYGKHKPCIGWCTKKILGQGGIE